MLFAFLNKPYPYFKSFKEDLASYSFIGAFVALFLIVFQPFEISAWITEHKNIKLLGFGLISFIIPTAISFLIPNILPAKITESAWTVYKEMLVILTVLLCIAMGNLFYGRFLGIMPINGYAWLMALAFTFLIGVFPVGAHVVIKHNRLLKMNLQQSSLLNEQFKKQHNINTQAENKTAIVTSEKTAADETLHFIAENEKDVFSLLSSRLLFIESADNYSTIVFIENGQKKKQLLRSSLKRIENQLEAKQIIRCHRTYIVNLDKIKNVEGNAAGYKLFFYDCDDFVPVSRNYMPLFNERLNHSK